MLQQAGGSLPVKKLQPDYQTMYKRSPRASDYGVEALKELFKTSPLFKVCARSEQLDVSNVEISAVSG